MNPSKGEDIHANCKHPLQFQMVVRRNEFRMPKSVVNLGHIQNHWRGFGGVLNFCTKIKKPSKSRQKVYCKREAKEREASEEKFKALKTENYTLN